MRVLLLSGLTHGLIVALFAHFLVIAQPLDERGRGTFRSAVETAAPLDRVEPPLPPPVQEHSDDVDPENVLDAAPDAALEPDAFEPMPDLRPDFTFSVPSARSMSLRRSRPVAPKPVPVASSPPPRTFASPIAHRPAPVRPVGPTRGAIALEGNRPPVYPPRAESLGITGLVVLSVHLDRDGKIVDVEVVSSSGHPILDREAVRAVKRWMFRPALTRGQPVASEVEVPIRFKGI